ncbi:MAG: AAA family ATPase [Bradymonadia bacterium]|jgi:AAA15 family ATPase/GTPase
MLIEFRVGNFRSVLKEQVLSLVASTDRSLLETHTIETGLKAAPRVLRSAVLYGPNASGKSNIVRALQFMRGLVAESATLIQPDQLLNVQPFLLNERSRSEPSDFEATLLVDGTRCVYAFSLTKERITAESLRVYKAAKPQLWFDRTVDATTGDDHYRYGGGLVGPRHVWQQATRRNALFLSTAVQLNADALRPLYRAIVEDVAVYNDRNPFNILQTVALMRDEPTRRRFVEMLNAADISLKDVQVVTRKVNRPSVNFDLATGSATLRPQEADEVVFQFHHETANGNAVLGFDDESGGTRNLLVLAAPFSEALRRGTTLVVDEIEALHPLLVRELVALFHSTHLNPRGAQLIFATHDTSLLGAAGLFRRDQVWFVEKASDQTSHLFPLTDFSPRKGEALEKGYLAGRFGAVPFVQPLITTLVD